MRMARNIYHRKDGRFEGRYANGYDANGKAKYGSVFGKTYAEVKEKLEQAKSAVCFPIYSPMANPKTITEAVTAYLDNGRLRLKPSMLGVYRRYLDCYISPHFGKMRHDALTAEVSQGFVNKLIENGLSVNTVQSVFNLLKDSVTAANGDVFAVKFPKPPKKQVEYLSRNGSNRRRKDVTRLIISPSCSACTRESVSANSAPCGLARRKQLPGCLHGIHR